MAIFVRISLDFAFIHLQCTVGIIVKLPIWFMVLHIANLQRYDLAFATTVESSARTIYHSLLQNSTQGQNSFSFGRHHRRFFRNYGRHGASRISCSKRIQIRMGKDETQRLCDSRVRPTYKSSQKSEGPCIIRKSL